MTSPLDMKAPAVDIALLLEGTFPYVSGGVSSWVDKIIRAFPQYTFALVFIGSRREDYKEPVYEIPDNVVHFEAHFIQEASAAEPPRACPGSRRVFERVACLHDSLREQGAHGTIAGLMRELMPAMATGGALDERQFLHSEASWGLIGDRYEAYCTDPSFTDYFWTVRIMHRPIWQLARISETLVPAKVYHTISTGYAGFLGALLRFRTGSPLLVSEHGIYSKERRIDLLQSQWISDNRNVFEKDITQPGYLQDLWVRFFMSLGRICYEAADEIVSLFDGNRLRQVQDGAQADKTRVIPNGISIGRFLPLREQRPPDVPPIVAFIGRVVPIKDVKTFIRAIFIASRSMPAVEGWIIGPQGEDPGYAQECFDLVESLGMQDHVKFLGMQRVDEFLPQVGLVALSSVSEGLPLVVLEAFAAGVPVLSTDVGACRELIEGSGQADRELGAAGAVVPIANPELLAQGIIHLLDQPSVWQAAQRAAIARVERYYTDTIMEDSYRSLYEALIESPASSMAGER
jgi:glycosyltransferase involved in cell wall biosynthesis